MTARLSTESLAFVRKRLRQFREDYNVHSAPVDCFWLIREMQESGKIDIEMEEAYGLSDTTDARACYFPSEKCYAIFYKEPRFQWKKSSSGRRINFTLAHELGHIFCGHLTVPDEVKFRETIRTEDLEADAFAAMLLMPEEVIGLFESVQEAADALWVSESAIRRRMQETGILPEPRMCPKCGYIGIPPAARYCRICGHMLAEEPNPAEPPEVVYLAGKPRQCVLCGQEMYGPETECPWCGLPRRNTCVPEYNQPIHYAPEDAVYCEICGSRTVYSDFLK